MVKRKKKSNPIIKKHTLMPEHIKLNEKEKKELLEKYNISLQNLPKILSTDAAIRSLNVKPGDVIRIMRKSVTAGMALFYRCVI